MAEDEALKHVTNLECTVSEMVRANTSLQIALDQAQLELCEAKTDNNRLTEEVSLLGEFGQFDEKLIQEDAAKEIQENALQM